MGYLQERQGRNRNKTYARIIMFRSSIEISEKLEQQLNKVGTCVDMFENRDGLAVDTWMEWLKESEKILKDYGYSDTARLAGLRAEIVAEKNRPDLQRNRRKALDSKAASTVNEAQDILFSINAALRDNIDKVTTLVRQIMVPAKEAGIIQPPESQDITSYVENLLNQFKSHEQLKSSIYSAETLIGRFDLLRIIANELDFS